MNRKIGNIICGILIIVLTSQVGCIDNSISVGDMLKDQLQDVFEVDRIRSVYNTETDILLLYFQICDSYNIYEIKEVRYNGEKINFSPDILSRDNIVRTTISEWVLALNIPNLESTIKDEKRIYFSINGIDGESLYIIPELRFDEVEERLYESLRKIYLIETCSECKTFDFYSPSTETDLPLPMNVKMQMNIEYSEPMLVDSIGKEMFGHAMFIYGAKGDLVTFLSVDDVIYQPINENTESTYFNIDGDIYKVSSLLSETGTLIADIHKVNDYDLSFWIMSSNCFWTYFHTMDDQLYLINIKSEDCSACTIEIYKIDGLDAKIIKNIPITVDFIRDCVKSFGIILLGKGDANTQTVTIEIMQKNNLEFFVSFCQAASCEYKCKLG